MALSKGESCGRPMHERFALSDSGGPLNNRLPAIVLPYLLARELLMESAAKPSTLRSILQQRCPRCRIGGIFHYSLFRGFPKMCERGSIFDLMFDSQPGYFLSPIYFTFPMARFRLSPI